MVVSRLTGNLAFNDTTVTGILLKTIKGDYRFGDKVALSKLSINLIDQLLKIDPKERISLEDALKHPWFQILKQSLYARPSIDD
jgi:serine/threonine protein kinase